MIQGQDFIFVEFCGIIDLMVLVIEKAKIKDWFVELKKKFQVKDLNKSFLPAKKYFFPEREKIFELDKKSGKLTDTFEKKSSKDILIFGLNPADLEAMVQLDEIMSGQSPDFFYWQKRKEAVLIGLSDYSLSAGFRPSLADLFLEKINEREYQVLVLTEKGRKLSASKFFKKLTRVKKENYPWSANPLRKMLLDPELLAEAMVWSWKARPKIWDDLAERCLACGICTYVCPICHCFSIKDSVSLDNQKCGRCRHWTACTLPEFSRVAGNYNFHKTIKERYYNWYYHKFVRAYKEYGRSQCVACGRCAKYCPAGIKISEVIEEIVREYKKR